MYLSKFNDRLEKIVIGFIIAIFALKIILTFSQVVFRRIPGVSIVWSEELARYCLVWLSFVGGALGVKKGIHVAVEALITNLSQRANTYLDYFHKTMITVFSGVLIIWGAQLAIYNMAQPSPALGMPIGIAYMAIPISGVLIIVFTVIEFLETRRARSTNEEEGGE